MAKSEHVAERWLTFLANTAVRTPQIARKQSSNTHVFFNSFVWNIADLYFLGHGPLCHHCGWFYWPIIQPWSCRREKLLGQVLWLTSMRKQALAPPNTLPPNYKRNENKIPSRIWVISISRNWCNLPLVSSTDTLLRRGDVFRSGMPWWAVIFHPAFGSLTHMCASR